MEDLSKLYDAVVEGKTRKFVCYSFPVLFLCFSVGERS